MEGSCNALEPNAAELVTAVATNFRRGFSGLNVCLRRLQQYYEIQGAVVYLITLNALAC
jgi:hypothetical protein